MVRGEMMVYMVRTEETAYMVVSQELLTDERLLIINSYWPDLLCELTPKRIYTGFQVLVTYLNMIRDKMIKDLLSQ